jgi:hypothetical protein
MNGDGMTEKDPFEFLDFTEEEAQEALEEVSTRGGRDGRICLCGHPNKRHTTYSGIVSCTPTKMSCPCKKVRLVVDASDTRPFLRKTHGAGVFHALGQAMVGAKKSGISVEWIVDMKCDRCGVEGPVSPVPVNQRGISVDEATGYDALLCRTCREEV